MYFRTSPLYRARSFYEPRRNLARARAIRRADRGRDREEGEPSKAVANFYFRPAVGFGNSRSNRGACRRSDNPRISACLRMSATLTSPTSTRNNVKIGRGSCRRLVPCGASKDLLIQSRGTKGGLVPRPRIGERRSSIIEGVTSSVVYCVRVVSFSFSFFIFRVGY